MKFKFVHDFKLKEQFKFISGLIFGILNIKSNLGKIKMVLIFAVLKLLSP